jgi:signal transduction histidine kinase/CheY-like chemotaxis protein/CHASE3 domain sensor protein
MARLKVSMPFKIALLLFAGVVIIVFSGYLSYKSISSVVTMIYSNNTRDDGLATIQDITSTIDRAENNVRLYGLTREDNYLNKYKVLITGIDSVINKLYNQYPEDEWFSHKIDTINSLIDVKIRVWREMISIWQYDSTRNAISDLTERVQALEPDTIVKQGFFKRIFGKDKKEEMDPTLQTEEILELLGQIERIEQETGLRLQAKETELTQSSNSLNEAFLSLMAQLESYEKDLDQARYEKAGELSRKTYILLGIFSLSGTILSILVLFLVIKYSRKNRAYNNALIQSRKETEELAKAKELFMANVSHEIRTPLNAISGFIKQILGMPLEQEVREKIDIVNSASDQLMRLTNDTLDFSKLQAGKLTLNNLHFDPGTEVKNVCTLLTNMAEKNGNKLSYSVENMQHTILFGDSQRFQQILYNLLSNALKFTENGLVEVSLLVLPLENDSASLILKVKDNGLGIDASNIDRIFQDFTQEDEYTAVRFGGTGLGLSIVKKLVEMFNGSVKVESTKGIGTLVTCNLRFQKGNGSKMKVGHPDVDEIELPEGIRFLVADDEEYNCKLITTILDKWKAEYDVAMNGVDAVHLLSDNEYDLVLMDLRMPGINGVDATKFIRETLKKSNQELPVFGITADTSYKTKSGQGKLFNAFLIKPFTESQLSRLVSEALGQSNRSAQQNVLARIQSDRHQGDLSNLIRMAGDDMGFVEEMITQFEKTTLNGLDEMEAAVDEGRFGTVRDLAHKLTPPGRHLGLSRLLEQLREIETKAPRGNRVLLRELISQARKSSSAAGKSLHAQFRQMKTK